VNRSQIQAALKHLHFSAAAPLRGRSVIYKVSRHRSTRRDARALSSTPDVSRVGGGCGPPAGPWRWAPSQRGGEDANTASRVGLSRHQSVTRPLARFGGTARAEDGPHPTPTRRQPIDALSRKISSPPSRSSFARV
jgi:hypothetical protein